MEINKEFIPYEQALALKELGFDEPCFNYYSTPNHPSLKPAILLGNNPSEPLMSSQMYKIGVWKIKAPLYQQAFKWFREKCDLHCNIDPWGYCIFDDNGTEKTGFKTYEQAELECLKKLIEIIQNILILG